MPVTRWLAAVFVVGLGAVHVIFAATNLSFARDCEGAIVSFRSCMVFYEGVLSALAGGALVASGVVIGRGRAGPAALLGLAGTAPLALFFWAAAVPAGLSDPVFAYGSLAIPAVAAAAAAAVYGRRSSRRSNAR